MRITETMVKVLSPYLNGKNVLEVACGDSEFSLNASKYAKEVLATDISLERIKRRKLPEVPENIEFREMNATGLNIDNDSFDVSVCYNALGHLENVLRPVLTEMTRVTKEGGYMMFLATWKMDKKVMEELEKIINEHDELTICKDIVNGSYKALIIKKKA